MFPVPLYASFKLSSVDVAPSSSSTEHFTVPIDCEELSAAQVDSDCLKVSTQLWELVAAPTISSSTDKRSETSPKS